MNNDKTKTRIRLDLFLVENGFYETRTKAEVAIREGSILVNNIREDKPGTLIKKDSEIRILGNKCPYVSRGGYKLEKAIKFFNINLFNYICIDLGSSTGGFTDVMLKNSVNKVYAVDCGTNQLDYRLRSNNKVIVMENTNARYIKLSDFNNDIIDFISADLSFISLKLIIKVIYELLKYNGETVILIKPQFEAGKDEVGKGGVVKDKNIHIKVITEIITFANNNGFSIKGLTYSPIKGPSGNIEYLLYMIKNDSNESINVNIENVVNEAHMSL